MIEIKKYSTRQQLIEELTEDVLIKLEQGIENRERASMLLSGGSTPGPLYEKMSNADFKWDKVWFAPTDERWVDPDHPDSNEKLIRSSLLKNKAGVANYIGLKSPGNDPFDGLKATAGKLADLPLPIDVVLLGMGEDGHFASLFPGLEDTQIAMDISSDRLCYPIRRDGEEHNRMSMTYSAILNSKCIILLFFGAKKHEVFEEASRKVNDTLPISHLLNQSDVPVYLYWSE